MEDLKLIRYKRHTRKYLRYAYNHYTSSSRTNIPSVCYTNWHSLLTFLLEGQDERPELDYLSNHVFPNLRRRVACIDIGANIGNHSLHFAQFFDKVISFEPFNTSFKLLKINTERCENVTAINLGCSNTTGKFTATGSRPSGLSIQSSEDIAHKTPVKSHTNLVTEFNVELIDNIETLKKLRSVDFIKIDVEGHEKACIEGAKKLLETHSPVIACEVSKRQIKNGRSDSIDLLKNFGYQHIYEFKRENESGLKQIIGHFNWKKKKLRSELRLELINKLTPRHHNMVLCSKSPLSQCVSD